MNSDSSRRDSCSIGTTATSARSHWTRLDSSYATCPTARLREARRDGSAARAGFFAAYRSYLCFLARDGIGTELQGKVASSDVAQDVLVAAQRDFPDFRGTTERELLARLRRMLANRIVDYARKYGARRKAQERSIEDILY